MKIFNLKTFKTFISFNRGLACVHLRLSYHLIEDLHVYANLCDKLHDQHVSGNDKDAEVYFYWCLPRQYLHSLHNYESAKYIVALDIR